MNCPFCHQKMWFDGYVLGEHGECESFACNSIPCLVNTEFPRYKCVVNKASKLVQEEYCIEDIYVKAYEDYTLIYKLMSCALQDQIQIQRTLFLNRTNIQQTLDKLKMMVIFS